MNTYLIFNRATNEHVKTLHGTSCLLTSHSVGDELTRKFFTIEPQKAEINLFEFYVIANDKRVDEDIPFSDV